MTYCTYRDLDAFMVSKGRNGFPERLTLRRKELMSQPEETIFEVVHRHETFEPPLGFGTSVRRAHEDVRSFSNYEDALEFFEAQKVGMAVAGDMPGRIKKVVLADGSSIALSDWVERNLGDD